MEINYSFKKLYLLSILFVSFFFSCFAQNNKQEKTDCLPQYQKTFNDLIGNFETSLAQLYSIDENKINWKHYKKFVYDLGKLEIPNHFFRDAERVQFVKELRKSPIHKFIWEKQSVLLKAEEPTEEIIMAPPPNYNQTEPIEKKERPDIWLFNTKTDFYNCLVDKTTNSESKILLNEFREVPDIAPNIIANAFMTIDSFEEDSTIRQFIVIAFYFQLINLFNQIE